MRKTIGFLAVLILCCSVPAIAQYPLAEMLLPISATNQGGVFVTVTPATVTFDVPLSQNAAENDVYVDSAESPYSLYLSYRLSNSNVCQLHCWTTDLLNPDLSVAEIETTMQHELTGVNINFAGQLPPPGGGGQLLWTSLNQNGEEEASIVIRFLNSTSLPDGEFTGSMSYVATAVIL